DIATARRTQIVGGAQPYQEILEGLEGDLAPRSAGIRAAVVLIEEEPAAAHSLLAVDPRHVVAPRHRPRLEVIVVRVRPEQPERSAPPDSRPATRMSATGPLSPQTAAPRVCSAATSRNPHSRDSDSRCTSTACCKTRSQARSAASSAAWESDTARRFPSSAAS